MGDEVNADAVCSHGSTEQTTIVPELEAAEHGACRRFTAAQHDFRTRGHRVIVLLAFSDRRLSGVFRALTG